MVKNKATNKTFCKNVFPLFARLLSFNIGFAFENSEQRHQMGWGLKVSYCLAYFSVSTKIHLDLCMAASALNKNQGMYPELKADNFKGGGFLALGVVLIDRNQ